MISASLSNVSRTLVDNCLKFVRQDCVLCGAASGSALLCPDCRRELPRPSSATCPVCGGPGDRLDRGRACGSCLKQPPAYDRCIAALRYAFPADELIQALKYGKRLALAKLLADTLTDAVAGAPRPDVIVPLPLHPDRARARGFNQAMEIAKPLARHLGLPIEAARLARTRNTAPQASLSLDDRRHNVKNAFACAGTWDGRHVALIDDVMTSGATLHEAAKALKRAGAAEVSLWVAARASAHH